MAKANAYSFIGEFKFNRVDFKVGSSMPVLGDIVTVSFSAETYKK